MLDLSIFFLGVNLRRLGADSGVGRGVTPLATEGGSGEQNFLVFDLKMVNFGVF